MNVTLSALVVKNDLAALKPLYREIKEKLEAIITPLTNPADIFETDEYNALIFNHFPVEVDVFSSSQNFYYSFYTLEYFMTNCTILLENHVNFESIDFDPVTLVCLAKFKKMI